MRRINVGVIGVGIMGETHVRVFSELEKAHLVSVADIDEQRAKEVAERYRVKKWYTDYNKLLEKSDVDAVCIATPDQLHLEPVLAAAKAGKDIFLEKPIASNLKDSDEIIRATKKSKVKLMVGHILRFDPSYVSIKQSIEDKSIGEIISVYGRRNSPIRAAQRLKGRVSVTLYQAIHDIDIALWYTNDKVERVYAESVKKGVYKEYGVPDWIWTLLKFKNGAIGSIEAGWGLPEKWLGWGDIKMQVIGTRGSAFLDYFPMSVKFCDQDGWKFPDTYHEPTLYGRITGDVREEIEHFLNCIIEDKQPLVTGEQARAALEVALAADLSQETGKPVPI